MRDESSFDEFYRGTSRRLMRYGFLLAGDLPDPDPIQYPEVAERLTEIGVIVALMGAGLKLDRRIGWKFGAWHDVAWTQLMLVEGAEPPAGLA